jgi:hypothetical protein
LSDNDARLLEIFGDDLVGLLDVIGCHLESIDCLVKGERLSSLGLDESLGLSHELHDLVVQSQLVDLLDDHDLSRSLHANLVSVSVGDTELSDDVVSVALLARKNIVEYLDTDLDCEGFSRLDLRNWDLDVVQEEFGVITVARFEVESLRVGPLGSVLESELDFHDVTSPSS